MKVAFLIHDVYGFGGTVSATVNLARAMAKTHEVEIVSMFRSRETPRVAVDRSVRIVPLVDLHAGSDRDNPLASQPSAILPDSPSFSSLYTRLLDERVESYLHSTRADVVIGTRPVLNMYLSHFGDNGYLRIGQEHLTHDSQIPAQRVAQNAVIKDLDAFVTVSSNDAQVYRDVLPQLKDKIFSIPNGVPRPTAEPSDGDSRIVLAVGRLIDVKRYDVLVRAFLRVATERPDWSLRIYGAGQKEAELRALIDELGLYNHVKLMGAYSPIEPEWPKGSIAASSSRSEALPMNIIEAMHAGLPVVSTDCPFGPREIIDHGVDGLLVPVGDDAALAAGLLSLINDEDKRRSMGRAARAKALRFSPDRNAERYDALFDQLLRERARTGASRQGGLRAEARCRATPDGRLQLAFTSYGPVGPGSRLTARLRGEVRAEVTFPLSEEAADGAEEARGSHCAQAVVDPALLRPHEGIWDLYLDDEAGQQERRVVAGPVELRHLATRGPSVRADGASHAIPYRTMDGFVAVRTWYRPHHAEVRQLHVGADALTVSVTLCGGEPAHRGDDPAQAPTVLLRHRTRPDILLELPAHRAGQDLLTVSVPHRTLVDHAPSQQSDIWDMWVSSGPSGSPAARARLGKLSGDFIDRKRVEKYPHGLLTTERGTHRAVAYFTDQHDLSVAVHHDLG
ncbi:glycosyltransferase [Streptomyces sp. NPDC091272]|uniref:glycosyltransferase n=1 Tax=Streptomyces sp. NPDC091272 TaxID=3365981 RepID=UPI0038278691